jgi:hypothetical protein
MIPHSHDPHEHGKDKPRHSQTTGPRMGWHKDWRTWAVIGLMLAAIGTYVLTLDQSIQPGSAAPNAGVTTTIPGSPPK